MSTSSGDLAASDGYFPAPYSLDPLTPTLRHGMIAPAIMGLISAISTLVLIIFILQRMIMWRRHYRTFIGYNQYVMLVLNLLIADLQQAAAFLITWYWIAKNKIAAPTAACFAQGWLLHSGNVSSALFVLAIASHTFLTAVLGKRITHSVFYGGILSCWILAYTLTAIGVGMHPTDYFVRAGAWCWVSSKYQDDRLFLHYLWVFFVEFSTVSIYAITFVALRRKTRRLFKTYREHADGTNPKTVEAVNRVTWLMTLYPCIYIVLTLPLSSGRMWSMAHDGASTSDAFSLTAGALLASCGWADALLYALTRKKLLGDTMPRAQRGSHENILATKSITVHDHGPVPATSASGPQSFMNAQQQHTQFESGSGERTSGCLIDTPPSRSEDADPMLGASIESEDQRPGRSDGPKGIELTRVPHATIDPRSKRMSKNLWD